MLNFRKNQEKCGEAFKSKIGEQSKWTEHCNSRCENFARWKPTCENAFQGVNSLNENFAHHCSRYETPSWHTSVISHTSRPFSHRANQGAKISHTSIQGAKFIPVCVTRCKFPKCQFRTPLFKVRKFSHSAKSTSGTRVPFSHTSSHFSHRVKQGAKDYEAFIL